MLGKVLILPVLMKVNAKGQQAIKQILRLLKVRHSTTEVCSSWYTQSFHFNVHRVSAVISNTPLPTLCGSELNL